jgi:hypothetical protein
LLWFTKRNSETILNLISNYLQTHESLDCLAHQRVISFRSGVKKVGGMGLGLMGKAYNAATGKKSRPAAPEEVKQRVKSTRHRDASDSGGIACKDVATVKDQRSVFSEVIKQIGKNVFAGRDLMYTPVAFPMLYALRHFWHVHHVPHQGKYGRQHFRTHLSPILFCAFIPDQSCRI